MKRDAVIYKESPDGRICVALDADYAADFLEYIYQDKRHEDKFNQIVDLILRRITNRDLYDKEAINSSAKDVTAMKLFKGRDNDRIYCKQVSLPNDTGQKIFVVVAAKLHKGKKSQANTSAEKRLINAVADYEYDYRTFVRIDEEDDAG